MAAIMSGIQGLSDAPDFMPKNQKVQNEDDYLKNKLKNTQMMEEFSRTQNLKNIERNKQL